MRVNMADELKGVLGNDDAVGIDGIFDLEQKQRDQRCENRRRPDEGEGNEDSDLCPQIGIPVSGFGHGKGLL